MESLLRTATVNSFAVIYTSLTKNSIYVKGLSPLFLITNKLHEISRLNFKFGDDVSIEVIDINGKIIQLQQVQLTRGYNHLEVDLSEIPSGVYMINFVGTRDYIKESRIIKQ